MSKTFDMYIAGHAHPPANGSYFDTVDPSSGKVFAKIAKGSVQDVEVAVEGASSAQPDWAKLKPLERGAILRRVAETLRTNRKYLADIETREMGMPFALTPSVIDGTADYFEYYAGLTPMVHGDTIPVDKNTFAYTLYDPYGVVAVITPWNAPVNQAARSVAPALAAGNTVVLKPSEHSSVATIEMARLAHEAGLPTGVLNVVTGFGKDAGEPLARHRLVEKISFTGSVKTGSAIGAIAGERIVPVTLELGGKSPDIVFDDAKLEVAVPQVLFGFVLNSGQICTSGTRVIVQRSIYEKFGEMLAKAAEKIPLGVDKPFPALGPIANKMQFDKVLSYFESAKHEGATVLTGGARATGEKLDSGYYIRPTIYTDVNAEMKIVKEEIFGPVGVLIPFDSEDEAIAIANDTDYGLAAGLWSQDASRVHRVAAQLQAGTIYINAWHAQDTAIAMGGYKRSGVGRERGLRAMLSYMQTKNVTQKLI